MEYLHNTPHCGRFCWRAQDGTERHYHANVRMSRRRKHACKDTCCRVPRRQERHKVKQDLHMVARG